jgi:hypothetical protein
MTQPNEESKNEVGEHELGQAIPELILIDTNVQASAFAACEEKDLEIKPDQAEQNEQKSTIKKFQKQS